jgi:hypothetical protein
MGLVDTHGFILFVFVCFELTLDLFDSRLSVS